MKMNSKGGALQITNANLAKYVQLFDECGKVMKGEGDNPETFMKFKYACGRNWDKVKSLYIALLRSPAYQAMMHAREESQEKYCTKDAEGQPILKQTAQGEEYTFTKENQALCDAEVHLVCEELMEEVNLVELFKVPFATVPEKMAGAYIKELECMLTDLPT
jgi:hypothetical protein